MAPSDTGPIEQGHGPEQKQKTSRRSLRAVFAADMTGFSGQMSANETGAVNSLNEVRVTVIQQLQTHGGWLFGMPGDGMFALFESAVNAVRCALETQQQLALRGQAQDMRLRIGIHLGDVLFEDDLPYGEALTIAARLEALADPGGILVSGAVMDAVSARISATFEERGVPRLKNIPRRIVTFAVTPPPARSKADETRVGMSILDRTTHLDPDTLRQIRDQQFVEQMQSETVNGNIPHDPEETSPRVEDLVGARTPDGSVKMGVAPAAGQPPKDIGKLAAHEPPERQTGQTAMTSGSSAAVSEADSRSGLPAEAAKLRPSAECIESLTAALAVHLGPFAKVLVNRHLKDASNTEQLVSLLEKQIQSNEERFMFRMRASHICMTFANQPTDQS